MHKRPLFWLGLLLGVCTAFRTRRRWKGKPPANSVQPLLDLVDDAMIVCDASGAVTDANAAAMQLCSGDLPSFAHLCYPSGQRVPPGQLPQTRALRTGTAIHAAGYRFTHKTAGARVLDVTATPLPAGGVAVVFRDGTALEEIQTRTALVEARQYALQSLCRRLSLATDAGALAQAVAETAFDLLAGLPDARVEVSTYDPAAQRITRLASIPDSQVKHPKSLRETQPQTLAFDASLPLHWQLYVAKQPYCSLEDDQSIYALPLIAAGSVLGQLTVTCRDAAAFEDAEVCAALGSVTTVAALALAGPQSANAAASLAAQVEALRRVVLAVAADPKWDQLADLMTAQVRQVTGAELCTLTACDGAGVRLLGKEYRDALLRPERHAPSDPALWDKTAQKAMKTGRIVMKIGIANPSFELGPWRVFAGQSGQHSVLAVPLRTGQGALTVYIRGASGFSDTQTMFVETLAALFPSTEFPSTD